MKKIIMTSASFFLLLAFAVNLHSSPETERIKRCRPVFDKCMEEANKTRNPKYNGMERDERNEAIKAEREKCKQSYEVCK
jgi:hypothetical protein